MTAPAGVPGRRSAGILLHPTSLPDGKIGECALAFVDFLRVAGCRAWQVLPLGPTGHARSPYSLVSAFAGGASLLPQEARYKAGPKPAGLADFIERERSWLLDYALFAVLKSESSETPWWQWPLEVRDRQPASISALMSRRADDIANVCRDQFRFAGSWGALRRYANEREIVLYGDLPMFPVADSADVWVNRHLFKLEPDGRTRVTAGVPPDLFAADGQSWGNPVYDWDAMRDEDFRWWRDRVRHELLRFDLLRWDHFRGLIATWEIPESAKTAREGEWRDVPGRELLTALQRDLGELPLVAENLGIITPEVEQLRRDFGLPGMHVFQFAFDGTQDNPHLPENHEEQGVAYTGTHDNDTTLGWFQSLTADVKDDVLEETGGDGGEMPWPAIRAVLQSRARLAVVPMQDYLSLDATHRMNRPGVAEGNWRWQLGKGDLTERLAERIRDVVVAAAR
ncbi:MAG: 4-alpha-glucanotransferase [Woeseia sp.]